MPLIPSRVAAAANGLGAMPTLAWACGGAAWRRKRRHGTCPEGAESTVRWPLAVPGVNAWARENHPVTPSPRHPVTPSPRHPSPATRRGMTLVELLVVVSILLLIALMAIPAVRPGLEGQRIREAARMVNVFLGNARNRAEESGRPFGIEIERLGADQYRLMGDLSLGVQANAVVGQPLAGVVLHQVEVPPPYAGEYENSRIIITALRGNRAWVKFENHSENLGWYTSGMIRFKDMLKLNYQGHTWVIESFTIPNPKTGLSQWTFSSASAPGPPSTPAAGLPFQIIRKPVRTSVAPLQLPRGTAIDLCFSGATPPALFRPIRSRWWPLYFDVSPVTIVFSPNGAVDRLYSPRSGACRLTEPIYLLVGKRTRVPMELDPNTGDPVLDANGKPVVPAEDGLTNVEDLTNFWIAIRPQTGLVTTTEVADSEAMPWSPEAAKIAASRGFAAEGHAVGGR